MSYSATTGKLGLPQWVKGTKDHPDFLTDMNQAFEKIDGFAERTDNTVDGLPEQVDELAALVESMQEDVGEHTTELASLGVRVGIAENKIENIGIQVANTAIKVADHGEEIESIRNSVNSNNVSGEVRGVVATDSTGNSITVTVARTGDIIQVTGIVGQITPLWESISRDHEAGFMFAIAQIQSLNVADSMMVTPTGYGILCNQDGVCGFGRILKMANGDIKIGIRRLSVAAPTADTLITGTIFDTSVLGEGVCETEI